MCFYAIARLCMGCFSTTELLWDRVLLMAACFMKLWLLKVVWGSSGTCTFSTRSDMLCFVDRTVLLVHWGIEML